MSVIQSVISIRTWWDIDHDSGLGLDLDPVEEFVHHNEPTRSPKGNEEQEWRDNLQTMLQYVYAQGVADTVAAIDDETLISP